MNKEELEQETESVFNDLPIEVQYYINSLSDENIQHYDFIFALWELLVNQPENVNTADVKELLRAKVVQDRNNIKTFKTKINKL